MPSRHYRRKVRAESSGSKSVVQLIAPLPVTSRPKDGCEIEKIRGYFLAAVDMIIERMDFANAVITLNDIIATVKSRAEYFPIINLIEKQLLGVLVNISNATNPKIIEMRLEYIKTYIDQLPADTEEIGPISNMMSDVMDLLVKDITTAPIVEKLTIVRNFIRTQYGPIKDVEMAQDSILNMIDSIGRGTHSGILEVRANYIQELVTKIVDTL